MKHNYTLLFCNQFGGLQIVQTCFAHCSQVCGFNFYPFIIFLWHLWFGEAYDWPFCVHIRHYEFLALQESVLWIVFHPGRGTYLIFTRLCTRELLIAVNLIIGVFLLTHLWWETFLLFWYMKFMSSGEFYLMATGDPIQG